MNYRKLGRSGLEVSPICMGCMSVGDAGHVTSPRAVGVDEGRRLIRSAVDAVGEIAARIGAARSSVALAWLLQKAEVAAPVVGTGKPGHLSDAIAALDVELSDAEPRALDAASKIPSESSDWMFDFHDNIRGDLIARKPHGA